MRTGARIIAYSAADENSEIAEAAASRDIDSRSDGGAQNQSTYIELTDSSAQMRRMVSASNSAIDNCRIFLQA